MSRQNFYRYVEQKLFYGSLPDWQQEPLDRIIDEGVKRKRTLSECAYVLATAYHETDRFKAMEEYDKGGSRPYADTVPLNSKVAVGYWGRGFVMLTWLFNYVNMERKLGVKIVDSPDRVKEPEIACQIIWEGMIAGDFTGKGLADYRQPDGTIDYVNARRIVNGMDKAEKIAEYAETFEQGLILIDKEQETSECPLRNPNCPN